MSDSFMNDNEPKRKPRAAVIPLLLGPANCESAVGFSWRFVRDHAPVLGVPIIGTGRKRCVRADLFVAALERSGAADLPSLAKVEPEPVDAAEAVRRAIGVSRRGGER